MSDLGTPSEFVNCGVISARIHNDAWESVFLPMYLKPERWDQVLASIPMRIFSLFHSFETNDVKGAWPVKLPIGIDGGSPFTCDFRGHRVTVGLLIGSNPTGYQFIQDLHPYVRWILLHAGLPTLAEPR
jgi:hypothetical protein